jgi:glycosyltransferase involved in cell wall biosynthesis
MGPEDKETVTQFLSVAMNIIHVVEPFASGVATFVRSLVENLQDDLHIIIHGERENVLPSAEVIQYFPAENTRFIKWPSAQRTLSVRKDTAAFWELYTILRRLKQENYIDAVHLHSSKSGFLGRLACKLASIPTVVYTPNGAPFLTGSNRIMQYLYGLLERVATFFGGTTVCCSTSEWEAYHAMGIEADVINNGVQLDHHVNKQVRPPASTSRFRIVTSGRITDQKYPSSFNTIAKYFEDSDDFEFVWVGDGEDRHQLTAKNITITGWLDPEETNEYVAGAEIYLSTSHFEGLPFSVLEALALKRPVLLSDCIGNRDIVHGGVNGDLFDDEQEAILKILRYFNNREMLGVMGEYSRQLCAQQFDVNTTYNSYRQLYTGRGHQDSR